MLFQNIGYDIFMGIWAVLDVLFGYIDFIFRSIFDDIPNSAIAFLIGIISYSVLELLVYIINKQEAGNRKMFLKFFRVLIIILTLLFTIWRFGIISQISPMFTYWSITEFVVNMIYILFALILVIAFLRKITWLKKAIILLLWILFTITTFITSTIFEGFVLTNATLIQYLLVGVLFIVPYSITTYKKGQKEGV